MSASLILASLLFVCINAILIDQTIPIESNRDIGTTYTLSIDTDQESMTLTMIGPEDIWMGIVFGPKADSMNGPAYIYYFDNDNNEWILTERLLQGTSEGPGQLIETIDANNYQLTTENGITTIIYQRAWIGSNPTSFTLSDDDLIFTFGFARGIDGILAYHGDDGRSHAQYTLKHLCCSNCTEGINGGCADDPECTQTVCRDFNQLCCNNEWRQECSTFAQDICINTAPQPIETTNPPDTTPGINACCDCLTPSRADTGDIIIGCDQDPECEDIICDIDRFCCGAGGNDNSGVWDTLCVNQANAVCNGLDMPSCCACTIITNGVSGCEQDTECENAICNVDAFCCGAGGNDGNSGFWDNVCVGQAVGVCNGEPLPSNNNN